MKRVLPSKRTKNAIEQLLNEGTRGDMLSELVRLSVRQVVEESLEGVVRDVLGRGYYERGGTGGYRNGYRAKRMKTSEGEVEYMSPQVTAINAESLKGLRQLLAGRTDELERLAVEMYARGCSTRDIEAIFRDENGKSFLSRTAVSELTEVLWAEYEEFVTRDLSQVRPLYLFLDGLAERLRPGARRDTFATYPVAGPYRSAPSSGTKISPLRFRAVLHSIRR